MVPSEAAAGATGKVEIKKMWRLRPQGGYPFFLYYLGESEPARQMPAYFSAELILSDNHWQDLLSFDDLRNYFVFCWDLH